MVSFCPQCGAKQDDGAIFCGSCGSRLEAAAPTGPPPPPQAAPPAAPPPAGKPKGRSVFRMVLYGLGIVVLLFVGLVVYALSTDKNDKPATKAPAQTQAQQQPKPQQQPQQPQQPQQQPQQQAQAPQQQPQQQAQQQAPAATAKAVALDIGSGFDSGQFKVTGMTEPLPAARMDVAHAVVYIEGVTSPVAVKTEWMYLGTRESVWSNDVTLEKNGAAHFELSKPTKGWPAGESAIKVYINGKEAGYRKFTIR